MTNEEVEIINKSSQYLSRYRGVWYNKKHEWRACFQIKGTKINMGPFPTEEEAIKAYDKEFKNFYRKILANVK